MESLLAKAVLEQFTLDLSLTKYEMTVDLLLRYAYTLLISRKNIMTSDRPIGPCLSIWSTPGGPIYHASALQSATEDKDRDAVHWSRFIISKCS